MPVLTRSLHAIALESFSVDDPMVFITGPRQAGKTFLARGFADAYFNWDTIEVKKAFLKNPYFFRSNAKTVCFDEIHKRRDWKKLLKGYYDSPERRENFVVTGSGRFDHYRKGGDSLQGRYFSYQLHPLAYDEIYYGQKKAPVLSRPRDFAAWEPHRSSLPDEELRVYGGFPQPFLRQSARFSSQWNDAYLTRLVREDIRDFSAVERIDAIEMLARLLPSRLQSPLSIKSLSEDVDVSPVAIKSWMNLFDNLYLGFFVSPWHRKVHRSVKKERKWYYYQWTFAESDSAQFENYIAVQLGAICSYWTKLGYGRWELYYLRDQDRREIDFVLVKDLVPKALVEAKGARQPWPAGLHYYAKKLGIPAFLVYPRGEIGRIGRSGWSLPAASFLRGLLIE